VYRDHRDFTSSDWTSQFEGRVWDKTPKNWTIRNSHFHAVDEPQWQANNEYRIPSWMHYTSPGYQPFWHFSHSEYMLTFYGAADIAYNNNEWVHDAVELAFKDDKGNDLDVNAWEEWISGILSNEEALAVIDAYAREDDASPLTLSQLENAGAQDIIDDNLEVYKVVIEDEESIPDLSSLQNAIDAANAFAVVRSFADSDDASGLTVQLLLDCGISFRSDRMEYYKTAIAGVESTDLPDIAALQALIDITTGMEKDRSMQVFVYPNPFTDIIRINGAEGICALEIMDTSGKLLYRFTGTIPGSLDLTELDSGLYLVRIKGEEEIRMQKLIKK
jgi:hypothetical protein